MALGDSLTGPVGAQTAYDWFSIANHKVGTPLSLLAEAGTAGQQTGQMLARVNTDVVALSPNYCTVLGGTNDVGAGVAAATTQANLASIYDALAAAGIGIIAFTIPPRTSLDPGEDVNLRTVNAWLRNNIGTWPNARLCDWSAALSENADEADPVDAYFSDGVHWSASGATAAAAVLAPILGSI